MLSKENLNHSLQCDLRAMRIFNIFKGALYE